MIDINNFDFIANEENKNISNNNSNNNKDNLVDFSFRSDPNYRRGDDTDIIAQQMRNTDWEQEAKYFNYYRRNGKTNIGNTIKCKNTDYLKRLNNDR